MTKMTYGEQLRHPNWQRKRLTMLDAAGWKCAQCESKENSLHVHHKRYVKGRMAWEYEDKELEVLCDQCHTSEHGRRDLLDELLAKADSWMVLQRVVGMLGGYLSASYSIPPRLQSRSMDVDSAAYTLGMLSHGLAIASSARVAEFTRETYRIAGLDLDPCMQIAVEQLESRAAAAAPQSSEG
jgi:hypothetical protein